MRIDYQLHGIRFEWESEKVTSFVLFQPDQSQNMKGDYMKSNNLKKRLQKNRPMDIISLRIPKDVIDDLKRIAPLLGFSGYQPLIRAYIGQGLRVDLERLEGSPELSKFVESLKRRGVNDTIISEAISEVSGT